MPDLPVLDWPVQFVTSPDGTVDFATVEQDSTDEHKAAAAVIVCTQRGERPDADTYGITELVFQQGGINTDRLADEINESDDRLDVTATDAADVVDATRREITVTTGVS